MPSNPTITQVLFYMFDLLFDFWPVLVLSAIKGRRHLIRNLLVTWGFWAVVRVVLFFNPEPILASFLIPEPLNTVLFFVTGAVLVGLQCSLRLWQRTRLMGKAKKVNSVDDLRQLSPREFEDVVVETYAAFGHQAKRTGATGDHGVDVVVHTKAGEKHVVQCKRWRGNVGEPVVRDFYGVVHHEKADKGILITTGKFTSQARVWAAGKPMSLIDGGEFLEVWKRVQAKRNKNKVG
jgi:hypothetical protein